MEQQKEPIFATISDNHYCIYYPRNGGISCRFGNESNIKRMREKLHEAEYIFDITNLSSEQENMFIEILSNLKHYSHLGTKQFDELLFSYSNLLVAL